VSPQYDLVSAVWGFGQDARWRRFLVSRIPPGSKVLDVATGTGMVAAELARRGCHVTGLDQSESMIRRGGRFDAARFVVGQAERLPFEDATFDAVTFTYLLRYVDDPAATMRELARVVKPEGTVAFLEFFIPPNPILRAAWLAYTRAVMPTIGRVASREWWDAGRFLGHSITNYYRSYPLAVQGDWWAGAGMRDVRYRTMSLGGGVVFWGTKG
jgi:demethylmenaquinone methyltransferase/2-methoxy-6-polyprenyl-1,4-benzoquinol methylase